MKINCLRFLCFAALALGLVSCVEPGGYPPYGGGYGGGPVYTQRRVVSDYGYRNDYRNDYYRNNYYRNDYRTAYRQDAYHDHHQDYHHDDHHDKKRETHCYCTHKSCGCKPGHPKSGCNCDGGSHRR